MALPRSHAPYSRLNGEDADHDEDQTDSRKKGPAGEQDKNKSAGDDDDDDANEDNDLEINIRFGEGQDLSLRVPRTDTIAIMKEKIKEARPTIGNKYLRLIHSGKILADDKTLIDSLPKSLFTQVEVPKATTESTLTRIVSTVEAAASSTLTGIASRASEEKIMHLPTPRIQTHTSLGSILPTHVSHHHGTVSSDPLSTVEDHVSITITSDLSSPNNNNSNTKSTKTKKRRSTVMIPVQTGPIYFLCSLSDHPPAQPQSAAKKGKAVARGSRATRGTSTTTPSNSTAASSSLALPGQGNGSSRTRSTTAEEEEEYEDDNEEPRDGELSPIMVPQPTGFDRLREAGFSEEEIRSIRRQFHASRGTTTVGENGIEGGLDQDEDAAARARRIEEEWIDQHGAETLPDGLEGSYGEMVWGLMLGFFMGLIALFWFKEATFSRRHQMGIIAGLMINVGFGVLHLYY
ncbi:hypothetical protein BG005_011817 [Podila minutissima]|nr:hypothetical protein BG005_011817 [Podila minutissima]